MATANPSASACATEGSFIEPMRLEDVATVLEIDRRGHGGTSWDEEMVRGEIERSWARVWVMRREGAAIAFIVVWLVQDELHVLNVATDPLARRQGHARALITYAIAFGVEHKIRHVLLEVRRTNAAAIALYRALGFVAFGLRERYYPDDEDAVEMILRLDPETGAIVPGRDEVHLERDDEVGL